MMNGGLQLNQDGSSEESDEPGDSAGLAVIEQILLSGDLSIPKNLIPQEIEEEVDDAIEDILGEEEDDAETIEGAIDTKDAKLNDTTSEISVYHSADIMRYWQIDNNNSPNPYYKKEAATEYTGSAEAFIGAETKQFDTAVKENYNTRMRNELGITIEDDELSEEEKARSYTFKIMNPSLWKWMYEASSFLVLNRVTT